MESRNHNTLRVAVLTENGFEQSELTEPVKALRDAGIIAEVVSPQKGKVKAWDHDHWGIDVEVDRQITEVTADDYDGLLLPGGVLNPDKLRTDADALEFIREFFRAGKVVAAICHGPQSLISAGVVKDRKMTSYPAISVDLTNAGAIWVNEEVVVDNGLVTSRKPADIPAFNRKLLEELKEGRHEPANQSRK